MRIFLAFLFLTFFEFSLFAQTQIAAGNVSGAWYKANSPYIINGEIVVQPGTSLTINPGVKVLFNGHFALTIRP